MGLVKSHYPIQGPHGVRDALPHEIMLHELAKIGGVADGHETAMGQGLSGQRRHEIEVMADDQVGLHCPIRLLNGVAEGRLELPGHLLVHIPIAGRLVGHDVGHAADGKRQVVRLEPHREDGRPLRERALRSVPFHRSANHGVLMAHLLARAHEGGKVDAASRRIRFLTGDVQYLQGVSYLPTLPSPKRDSSTFKSTTSKTLQSAMTKAP